MFFASGIPSSATEPGDAELIGLIRAGRREALELLVDRHLPVLQRFVRYLRVPDHGQEDLMQETFEKAIRSLQTFDPKRSFSTWLLSICRNSFLDARRKEGRSLPADDLPFEVESGDSVEASVLGKITVEQLVASLDEADRLLIELRVFQEMPFAEIAELLAVNESTVRGRFFRLLSRLRTNSTLSEPHRERTAT